MLAWHHFWRAVWSRARPGLAAATIAIMAAPVAQAALPGGAQKVFDEVVALDMPVLPAALAGQADKFVKKSSSHYEITDIGVGEVTGRLVFYKPPGKSGWLFAAVFKDVTVSNVGIGDGGLLDQVALQPLVVMQAPENWSDTSVSSWAGQLGTDLKDIAKKRGSKLDITKGLNVFARLDGGASGEVADILKAAGITLDKITLEAHKEVAKATKSSKKQVTLTVQLHHFEDWSKPFGLTGTKLKKLTLQMKKDRSKNKSFQAWGDFTLKGKTYFLWGAQTKGPKVAGRAFGLSASEIAMSVVMDFADTLPALKSHKFGKAVKDKLPVKDIKILNAKHQAHVAGTFPDLNKFTLLYAEPNVPVADTRWKGPLFAAGGTAEFMKWKAATLQLFMDPKGGTLNAKGKMASGDLSPLPMSNAKFHVNVDKPKKRYKMGVTGDVQFEGVTLAGAGFEVSKSKFEMEVNLGCIPPMLKGSLSAGYSKTSIPKLSSAKISGSGCGKKVGKAISDAAKKAGYAIKDGIKKVGNAIADLARSIGGKKNEKHNKDIPLFRTAAKHKLLVEILDDWPDGLKKVDMTSIILDEYDIPFDLGGIEVLATKQQIKDQKKALECQARGRMSALLKMKNSIAGAPEIVTEHLDAEIKFYEPFEDYKKDIKKILKTFPPVKKKDLEAWAELQLCENEKA